MPQRASAPLPSKARLLLAQLDLALALEDEMAILAMRPQRAGDALIRASRVIAPDVLRFVDDELFERLERCARAPEAFVAVYANVIACVEYR
jgi:hypothetical protein